MKATEERREKQPVQRLNNIRIGVGIALSFLSGMLLLFAYPPYGLWPLMWIAFVPMAIAQYRIFPRKWSSLAVAITDLVWLGPFLWRIFGTEAPWFLTYLGLLIAILNFFLRKEREFHERTRYRWFALQGIVDTVGFEMIRSFIPFLGTMGFLANSQASQPWLIQPIALFSIYGLGLMIMLVNFALTQAAFVLFDRYWRWEDSVPMPRSTNKSWLVGAGLGVVVWVGISLVLLAGAPGNVETVRVAALQSNYQIPASV